MNVVERLVLDGIIPTRILILVRDLMAFRLKINVAAKVENYKRESTNKNYMNVMFHNKGMDMINLSRILNSKKVMAAVPNYLRVPPPIVSYTYTRTIAGKILNNRKVVNELNMDCGTASMVCSCNCSRYKYESCGHVVTGDLSIIKDVKLRNLISKDPAYREQNNIDWRVNLKNCKAAVSRYAKKWAKEANVNRRVLRDWEETVYKFIDEKVGSLKQRKINKRKKHVLKSRVNLDNLNKLHEKETLLAMRR